MKVLLVSANKEQNNMPTLPPAMIRLVVACFIHSLHPVPRKASPGWQV